MKVLGRCGEITDLDVVLGTQLEKALKTGAGMFWPQTFPTMGEQQNQTAKTLPFGLSAGNV